MCSRFPYLLFLLASFHVLGASVIRVEPAADLSNTAMGTDWDTDVTNLQRALGLAVNGDVIWIAAGTYYPDEGEGQVDGDRDSTFFVPAGVGLYGGFDGTELSLEERDPDANVTVLSGDLDQNDAPLAFDHSNPDSTHFSNAKHVLWLDGGAGAPIVLDGFTVTAGFAGESEIDQDLNGAAVYSPFATVEITNCRFTENYAANGGGALYLGVEGSVAPAYYGGSLVSNCTFTGNQAFYGGALYSFAAEPEVVNCLFQENGFVNLTGGIILRDPIANGGAIKTMEDVWLSVTACEFVGNRSRAGGAISSYNNSTLSDDSSIRVSASVFRGNQATSVGGAIAFGTGGGFYSAWDPQQEIPYTLAIDNCLFTGNVADYGGGISASHPVNQFVITNSTLSGNIGRDGSASLLIGAGNIQIGNLIVWGNTSGGESDIPPESEDGNVSNLQQSLWPSVTLNADSNVVLTNSLIGSSRYHLQDGSNLNGRDPANDPQFLSADDFRLQITSPAVGRGDNSVDLDGPEAGTAMAGEVPYDLAGDARVEGSRIDLGAYETSYEGDYLDTDGDGLPDWFERMYTESSSDVSLDVASDEDGDGLTVMEEFVFGLDPSVRDEPSVDWLMTQSEVYVPGDGDDLLGGSPGYIETRDFFTLRWTINPLAEPFFYLSTEQTTDITAGTGWTTENLLTYGRAVNEQDPSRIDFLVRSLTSLVEQPKLFLRGRIVPK